MSKAVGSTSLRTPAPKPEILAALTDRQFLSVLGEAGEPLSRAEVADRSGLSRPAISSSATRMLERSLIREIGQRQGRRGGVATLLEVNAARGHALAVAVQPDAVRVRVTDFVGETALEDSVRLRPGATPEAVVAATNRVLAAAERAMPTPLLAAAFSMADPVDWATGEPVSLPQCVFPGGRFSPRHDLDLRFDGPLVVDNDVNWASLAAYGSGPLRGVEDFVYVYCGAGLGAGLVLGGRLHRGRRGLAGEIGYLRDDAGADLTERLGALGFGRPGSYELDMAAARHLLSHEETREQAEAAVATLARHVANLVIVANPAAVVLAGPLSDEPTYVDGLRDRITALAPDPPEVVVGAFAPLDGASREAHRLARAAAGAPYPEQSR